MKRHFLGAFFCVVWIGFLLSFLFCFGCASARKSVYLGVTTGALTGAGSLALMSHESKRDKGALIGALSGALVGGVAGYFIHGELEKRDAKVRKATLFNLDKYGPGASSLPYQSLERVPVPGITFPVESEDYIPTHRRGNQVVEGHRVWTLSDNAQWESTESAESAESAEVEEDTQREKEREKNRRDRQDK